MSHLKTIVRPLFIAIVCGILVTILNPDSYFDIFNNLTGNNGFFITMPAVYGFLLGLYFLIISSEKIKISESIISTVVIIILCGGSLFFSYYIALLCIGIVSMLSLINPWFFTLVFITPAIMVPVGSTIVLGSIFPIIQYVDQKQKIISKTIIYISCIVVITSIIAALSLPGGFLLLGKKNEYNFSDIIRATQTIWQVSTMFVFMHIFELYAYYKKQDMDPEKAILSSKQM